MASEAQLRANEKYLKNKKTMVTRLNPEEYEKIQEAARRVTGGSVQAYVLLCIRERMKKEQEEQA